MDTGGYGGIGLDTKCIMCAGLTTLTTKLNNNRLFVPHKDQPRESTVCQLHRTIKDIYWTIVFSGGNNQMCFSILVLASMHSVESLTMKLRGGKSLPNL